LEIHVPDWQQENEFTDNMIESIDRQIREETMGNVSLKKKTVEDVTL
jgi:hypothetical protein